MNNKLLRKMGIYILAGELVITPVTTSLCMPMTVYAEEVVIDNGKNIDEVSSNQEVATVNNGGSVTTNNGTIKTNEGYVTYNNGTINGNSGLGKVENNNENGTITTNNGEVTINNGKIEKNANQDSAVVGENKGTVVDNDGKVGTNKGTITTNNGLGTVTTNKGTVTTNTGTVTTNESTGTVTTNTATVATNNGTVATNASTGTVTTNESTGTVTTNNGTVATNNGTVATNASTGTVTTNESTGTVTTNNGIVATNNGTVTTNNKGVTNNYGTVTTNTIDAHVATNESTGTVATNLGMVDTNKGTISANYNHVETNNGTIQKNFANVNNNKGTITDNYGDTHVLGTGTVVNQWVRINTNIDTVEINGVNDSTGAYVRREQIEGVGTESILDDKDAIYILSGKSGYLSAGQSTTKILIPDETDETTKSFMDNSNLVYDSSTEKTWISLQNIESKMITLVFKLLNKENIPVEPVDPPVEPDTPPVEPAVKPSGEPEVIIEPVVTPIDTVRETNISISAIPSSNSVAVVTPSAIQKSTSQSVVSNYTLPDKQIVSVVDRVNSDGTTTNVATHVDGSVSETTKVSASAVLQINSVLANTATPTVVNDLSIVVDKASSVENAKVSGVTAVIDVYTVNGNISLPTQLISEIKAMATTQAGTKSTVDLKVNTLAADGKPVAVVISTEGLTNNASLKGYAKDPLTGEYILVDIPNAKYDSKNGLSVSGLSSGLEYKFVSAKEAKKIEQSILNSVKVSHEFANPVGASAGDTVDMTKALSSGLNASNVSEITYTVSGNKATIDPVTGQLIINGNATKGTITVSIKVTLKNGKTKTIKTKIRIS